MAELLQSLHGPSLTSDRQRTIRRLPLVASAVPTNIVGAGGGGVSCNHSGKSTTLHSTNGNTSNFAKSTSSVDYRSPNHTPVDYRSPNHTPVDYRSPSHTPTKHRTPSHTPSSSFDNTQISRPITKYRLTRDTRDPLATPPVLLPGRVDTEELVDTPTYTYKQYCTSKLFAAFEDAKFTRKEMDKLSRWDLRVFIDNHFQS